MFTDVQGYDQPALFGENIKVKGKLIREYLIQGSNHMVIMASGTTEKDKVTYRESMRLQQAVEYL